MFKEPISLFAYNLISLHHDIMWYMIIIFSLVYWTLYKIIKEYSWSVYNKQQGFLLVSYLKIFIKIQILILFCWYIIFSAFLLQWKYIIELCVKVLDSHWLKNYKVNLDLFLYFLGKNYYKGIYINFYWSYWNYFYFKKILIEKFLLVYLFSKPCNALYYYDGFDHILKTLKFKHSLIMEYIFGFFPTIIISIIIVPSMYLLYSNELDLDPCLTIKVLGHQWYWSYQSTSIFYLNESKKIFCMDYNFDSLIIEEADLIIGSRRLLETSKTLVLPYQAVIRFLISSIDVLHAWSIPELGIKVDAVPGRLNQIITIPNNLGVYYGQCSELCGVSHAFMPIKVAIITLNEYNQWISKNLNEASV